MSERPNGASAIAVADIRKRYGATQALDGVSFEIGAGEFHALLGENGAGKSTLIKILSGLTQPDEGAILVGGQRVRIGEPRQAQALGIRTAFQEISLVPDLSIADNLLLPDAPVHLGFVRDRKRAARWVEETMARLELSDIDPRQDVRDCALPIRQKLEIARAIAHGPRVLLLDEPTSALSARDVEWLARRMVALRQGGTTVVLITHRMVETRRFCDRLTILRNGRHVGSFAAGDVSDAEVVKLVIGRSLSAAFPPRPAALPERPAVPALAVQDIRVKDRVNGVSLKLWPGEILGIAGLQGMGQNELFYALFGETPIDSGRIEVRGQPVSLASPRDAIHAGIGISLVPEDRKTEALALRLPGRDNVALPVIDRYARFGWIDLAREQRDVDSVLARVEVHPRALYQPCASFSGGNQQKIAIAKWLFAQSRILMVFDPTRGVDVGTKHEIYLLLREFVAAGGAVLFYSTDVLEIVNLCDHVAVMYGGRLSAEYSGSEITEEAIMQAALGGLHPSGELRPPGDAAARPAAARPTRGVEVFQ
ncbi:MAG: sugar ABC transporter ATP-binding protein [Comamonadaceae bacterium]|nr:MAG: sugar ABC transporter ATP-binding protein [Comamonadaceae bacterium]